LRAQIAQHEKQAVHAEHEAGVALLDGKNTTAATKRAREAREAIGRSHAALKELERRQAEAEEEARTGTASAARLASYESLATYLGLMETYALRRDEFEAARAAIENFKPDPKFLRAKRGGRYDSADESDLDTDLLIATPDAWDPHYKKKGGVTTILRNVQAERARELRDFAESRAEEERSGNGVDRSQTYGTWDRQVTERRKARLAADSGKAA
jgi:hypothetical protein